MAVSGMTGIETMLTQMRAAVRAAEGGMTASAAGTATNPAAGSFATELKASLERVSSAQMSAKAQASAYELGAPNISLNDVMIDLQKANIGFQTAVQVRNRLVAAYKEISSISV
jgi:flagellar hook-basal body complex protein FliE